jgi:hypothetical protein
MNYAIAAYALSLVLWVAYLLLLARRVRSESGTGGR